MTTEARTPLRVFCSYAREDEEHLNVLREWLSGFERQGLIEWWHDREIVPGWEWEEAIDKRLMTADIILLLVTSDFLGSDYVYEKEIRTAIERYERGEARVVSIIVRPALWKGTPLEKFQVLPKDAKPVTKWPDRDEAWLNVTEGIQKAVEELLVEHQEPADKEQYREPVQQQAQRRQEERLEEGHARALALSISHDDGKLYLWATNRGTHLIRDLEISAIPDDEDWQADTHGPLPLLEPSDAPGVVVTYPILGGWFVAQVDQINPGRGWMILSSRFGEDDYTRMDFDISWNDHEGRQRKSHAVADLRFESSEVSLQPRPPNL